MRTHSHLVANALLLVSLATCSIGVAQNIADQAAAATTVQEQLVTASKQKSRKTTHRGSGRRDIAAVAQDSIG